jgi:membrane protease YdiL (CAAX protease family)
MAEVVIQDPTQLAGTANKSSVSIFTSRRRSVKHVFRRMGLFSLFLLCGLLVFVLGTSYYTDFPTNTSGLFKIGTSLIFLSTALIFRRVEQIQLYWRVMYGFFVASMVNVISWYFALYFRDGLFTLLNISLTTTPGITVAKVIEATLTIGTILILIKLAGENLASLYIRRGKIQWSLTIGILALVNLTASAFLLAANQNQDVASVLQKLPWLVVFALANGFMEEIWFRGLFLKRLQLHLGEWAAVWLTSIWFGTLHIFAVYVSGVGALIFGLLVFSLGIVFALVMQKTKNIWGAGTFHAAADINMLISFGMF